MNVGCATFSILERVRYFYTKDSVTPQAMYLSTTRCYCCC